MQIDYNHHCFACGELNPQGLKLKFQQEGDVLYTYFTPSSLYQGYPGVMHGGLTCTLLDDVMSNCITVKLNLRAMTARLEVRFRHGIPIDRPVRVEAWISGEKSRAVDTQGRVILDNGQVAAEATARFMIVA